MEFDTAKYLQQLVQDLLGARRFSFVHSRSWAAQFPDGAGVYLFREGESIVYVGETGSIRGRMKDMADTRNHTLRRSIEADLFHAHSDYTPASSKRRFCDAIEAGLNTHMCTRLTIAFREVALGRKELEEWLIQEHQPRYNKKGARTTF